MELTAEPNHHPTRILSYAPGVLLCACGTYHHSVVITAQSVVPFGPRCFAELSSNDLLALPTQDIELVLLGTGPERTYPLKQDFLAPLEAHGLAFEAMVTPAACRTFELLVAEGRKVMGVLLLA